MNSVDQHRRRLNVFSFRNRAVVFIAYIFTQSTIAFIPILYPQPVQPMSLFKDLPCETLDRILCILPPQQQQRPDHDPQHITDNLQCHIEYSCTSDDVTIHDLQRLGTRFPNAASLTLNLNNIAAQCITRIMQTVRVVFGSRLRQLHVVNADQLFERHFGALASLSALESLVIECNSNFCWACDTVLRNVLAQGLPRLTRLSILSPKRQLCVGDAHVAAIADACGARLQELVLCVDLSDLTDAGVAVLGGCPGLQRLVLSGMGVW